MSFHQTIYNLLRGYGFSEAGALGMLGNWECESNCEPYRVQGDYQASRAISKAYVDAIENRRMSREQFAGDGKGFGEAQWTYPQRKADLYDHWLSSPFRIDSCELQVGFAVWELQNGYGNLLAVLKSSDAIYDCTARICREYERPAVNNIQARYEAAMRIKEEINLDGEIIPASPGDPETKKPEATSLRLRTIDGHCSGWPEIYLLKSLLACHGYDVDFTDQWSFELTFQLQAFQDNNGLTPDGICGKKTWIKLGIDPAVFERS